MSRSGGTARASAACRCRSSASIRSVPSRWRASNRNTESGTEGPPPSRLAVRAAVSWNGSGLPSSRSAISSPSNTAVCTGSVPSAATTSGSRAVMSSSVRVNRRTFPPDRCAWILMPSSFHSTAHSTAHSAAHSTGAVPPILARASSMLVALEASIGRTGRPTSRPNSVSAPLPPARAAAATTPSEPRSITARRTWFTGTEAARATASVMTPSSAPWCSSPESRPNRNRCSSSVARPNSSLTSALRVAAEPFPETAPIAEKPASTSLSVSVGVSAGGNPSRSVAHPTPICRCGSSPDR